MLGGAGLAADAGRADDLAVGPRRFRVGRTVGEGGMGRVSEAEDQQFGRVVAFKERRGEPGDVEADRRFGLEAIVTANLEHPGIPAVYERGRGADGRPFYAMRFVRGRSFADVIREADGLAARLRLLPIVLDVAQTIGFAHQRGVIHRDIKPDNVMVGDHGDNVVVDWGLAKVRGVELPEAGRGVGLVSGSGSGGEGTRHGSVLGTPAYMAPEQADGRVGEIDERTDVFALGAIMYHLFTGRPPYTGTAVERLTQASLARPERVPRLAADTPPAIVAVIERAMAKRPADRYASARELAAALQDVIAEGLRGRESRTIRVFVDTVGVLLVATMIVLALGMLASIELAELGPAALILFPTFVLGVVLTVIEWRTAGRYALSGVMLGLAMITLIEALVAAAIGGIEVLSVILMAQGADPEALAVTLMGGVPRGAVIVLTGLAVALQLAATQVALWAVVRRSVRRSAAGRA